MNDAILTRRIFSGSPWEQQVGYARAVRIGDWLLLSGTTATQADGQVVGVGDVAAQTHFIFTHIAAVLAQAGFGLQHVVRTRMYVVDIRQWAAIGAVHHQFFATVFPAATMVQVAALIHPDHLIEIEVDACLAAQHAWHDRHYFLDKR